MYGTPRPAFLDNSGTRDFGTGRISLSELPVLPPQ